MHILIGRTITGTHISEDRESMTIFTTDGPIVTQTDADCCSYTWIEGVEMPALGFPAKVLEVVKLGGYDDETFEASPPVEGIGKESTFRPKSECDYLQYYGLKVVTDKGELVVDFRNDSNGYYGGSLSWPHNDLDHSKNHWAKPNELCGYCITEWNKSHFKEANATN